MPRPTKTKAYSKIQTLIATLKTRCVQLQHINIPICITADVIRRAQLECLQLEGHLRRPAAQALPTIETLTMTKQAISSALAKLGLTDITTKGDVKGNAKVGKHHLLSKLTDGLQQSTLSEKQQQEFIRAIAQTFNGTKMNGLNQLEQRLVKGLFLGISREELEAGCDTEDKQYMSDMLTSTHYEKIRTYFDPWAMMEGRPWEESLVRQHADMAHQEVDPAAERAARAQRRTKERKEREKATETRNQTQASRSKRQAPSNTRNERKKIKLEGGKKQTVKATNQHAIIKHNSTPSRPPLPLTRAGPGDSKSDPMIIDSNSESHSDSDRQSGAEDEDSDDDIFYDCIETNDEIAAINARSVLRNNMRNSLNHQNSSSFRYIVGKGEIGVKRLISSGTLDTNEVMWD